MQKSLKRILCLLLIAATVLTVFTGCLAEEETTEVVGSEQMMKDEYVVNSDITKYVSYWVDYAISYEVEDVEVSTMYNFFDVQVDDWDCVTIGVSTMGELVSAIERSNRHYIMRRTAATIDERQFDIDREYAKAAKEAAEKGKEYTKKKKTVRIDDIDITAPYTYKIRFGDDTEIEPDEYKPTLLVDPQTYQTIYLEISKYDIPYATFAFADNEIVNTRITQESDWIITGAEAASLIGTPYVAGDESAGYTSEYDFVDVTCRNKAAKKNMRMSGNIAFGGEGFTWESLMKLCHALQLNDDNDDDVWAYENYFTQYSDENFTYYQLMLNTCPFSIDPTLKKSGEIPYQITRLTATFDPLSQVCVDWLIDTSSATSSISGDDHKVSNPKRVNVHEYKVDTRDYVGMRNTIAAWIDANALETVTAYCAFDMNNKLFGVVDSGITNVTVSPMINGIEYSCLDYDMENGIIDGKFISMEDLMAADECETEEEANKYITDKTVRLKIGCYVIYDGNKVVCEFNENTKSVFWDETSYYVASYAGTSGSGYRNVRLLDNTGVAQLMVLYMQTYELSDEQYDEIKATKDSDGVVAVSNKINTMFAEAEKDQEKQQDTGGYINANELATFMFDESENTMNVLFVNDLEYNGFEKQSMTTYQDDFLSLYTDRYYMTDDWGLMEGEVAKEYQIDVGTTSSGVVYFLKVNDPDFVFYKDITVGMSRYDIVSALGPSAQIIEGVHTDYIIAESGDIKMTVVVDHITGEAESIYMLHYLFYDEIYN